MKKNVLFLIVLLAMLGCKSVRLDLDGNIVVVKSRIKESIALLDNSFRQSKGGIYIDESSSAKIKFKNKFLKKNNFIISIYNSDVNFLSRFLENFSSSEELNSFSKDEYFINVYKVTSDAPKFQNLDKSFKFILISKKEDEFVVVLENFSNFRDNVSEQFLLEKFNELDFLIN